jgi:hypothetical protein
MNLQTSNLEESELGGGGKGEDGGITIQDTEKKKN